MQDNVEDAITELQTTQNAKIKTSKTTSITDTYSCSYINYITEGQYSTAEQKTKNSWIDSKPIYRRVYTGTLGTAINHGLTNVNIINAYGFFISGNGAFLPLPTVRPNYPDYACGIYVNSTQILFDKGSAANGNCTIILEYTKTTD